MLIVHLQQQFVVEIKIHPKKNKINNRKYDLYMMFSISQSGFTLGKTEFNVNVSCGSDQWGNPRTLLKGNTSFVKVMNTTLSGYEIKAMTALEKSSNAKSVEEVRTFIQTVVRTEVTGRAIRGKKHVMAIKLKEATLENVIAQIKTTLRRGEKPLGEARKRLYDSVYEVLAKYYHQKIPLLKNITKKQLQDFKTWYYHSYNHKPETRSTYLGVISALFRFAVEEMELLSSSPAPRAFTPAIRMKDRRERRILDETEVCKLYQLPDETLKKNEMLAKAVMMLQLTTGIAYCDIISLRREHVKYNAMTGEWRIKKQRAKSGEYFTVGLSRRAKYAYDKLSEIAAGTDTIFNLPKLRFINHKYFCLAKRAKIPKFTSYDLRHTFSLHFADHGGRIEDLAEILGHQRLDTTRIYLKISAQRRSQTMKQITQSLIHQL